MSEFMLHAAKFTLELNFLLCQISFFSSKFIQSKKVQINYIWHAVSTLSSKIT